MALTTIYVTVNVFANFDSEQFVCAQVFAQNTYYGLIMYVPATTAAEKKENLQKYLK